MDNNTTGTKLEKLVNKAIDQLGDFFKAKEHHKADIAVARVSTAILGAWTRHKQTISAERATMFMVAREIAVDKKELARYIELTMPELGTIHDLPTAIQLAEQKNQLANTVEVLKEKRDSLQAELADVKDTLVKSGE